MIYLDNSATTKQYDEVTDLISDISKNNFGNPSSLHELGFRSAGILEDSRKRIAEHFAPGGEIFFTSGGTESDNTAIIMACRKVKKRARRVITTVIEHPAVLETSKRLKEEGFEIVYLPCDVDGYVEEQALTAELTEDTALVSVMAVNNEVGTIQPVTKMYRIVQDFNKQHGTGILFHTDAVQAFGKLSFAEAQFDMISISGHKFHGPKGTGALYIKKGTNIKPYILGGGQEKAMRSGTENLPGIAGIALAADMANANLYTKMLAMSEVNDYLMRGLMTELKDVQLNGPYGQGQGLFDAGARCPSVLNLSFEGTRGEVLLHTLEQDGIYVSTGSACASHHTGDSHVLSAMSMDHKEIESAVRFSFSEFNTKEEMDIVIDAVTKAVNRFRRLGSFR